MSINIYCLQYDAGTKCSCCDLNFSPDDIVWAWSFPRSHTEVALHLDCLQRYMHGMLRDFAKATELLNLPPRRDHFLQTQIAEVAERDEAERAYRAGDLMIEPTGPVWQRAKQEANWLTYRLIPKPGKKPAKVPQANGHSTSPEVAATLTYEQARELAEAAGLGIGYLPRAGSAMVCIDLDGVVNPATDDWVEAVLPGSARYLTYESYTEYSPSGTGLHVLLPREGWPTDSIDGGHPVGLHASAKYFFTVTLEAVEPCPVQAAPLLMEAVLKGLVDRLDDREREVAVEEGGEHAWFYLLDAEDRIDVVQLVLDALPADWVNDRVRWRNVTFALRDYPEMFEVWDRWCVRALPRHYNAAGNAELWHGRDRDNDRIKIGSFLHWAGQYEVDLGPYKRGAAAERGRRGMEGLAERLARRAPHLLEEAAQRAQERAQGARKTPEELLEEGLGLIVRHEPSGRYMHLGVPSTLHASERSTLHSSSIVRMYPVRMREPLPDENERDVPTVGAEIMRMCWMTLQGPIADPRVPFGAVYPERHGIHDYVLVNKLRLREVDASASIDPAHWALVAWRRVLAQVFPIEVERAWVEEWVACKAQRPWERMVAVLSVATTQGTGRGGFADLLAALFGRNNCAHITVEDLGGATQQWNDYLLALWVFVDELSTSEASGMAGRASTRRRGYEVLKSVVDPRMGVSRRINVKHGEAYQAVSFSSFLIASNHEDGLPIPDEDRRFAVLQGNEARAARDFAKLVEDITGSEEALAVIWAHLHRLDLSAFQPDMVLETGAKAMMVEAGKTDFDVELEGLLEALGWPLVVTTQLVERLAAGKSEIGRNMHRNGTLTPAVKRWMDDNSRPLAGDKVGGSRRIRVGGAQQRVRVLKRGEVGLKRATVDGLTNEQALKWLEALDRDSLSPDLSGATECRKLRSGLRVVK